MPWTLAYPLATLRDRAAYRGEVARLRDSPDVASVQDLRRDSFVGIDPAVPEGDRTVVIVRFVNELERTDDPALLDIYRRRVRPTEDRGPVPTPPPQTTPLPEEDFRQRIVSEYISTSAGRTRLAAAMVQPLRARRDYASVGRATFLVEQMPEGALPFYDALNLRPPDPPFGAMVQSGTGAAIGEIQPGRALINGLIGSVPHQVGNYLRLSGASNPANNGVYQIIEVPTSYSVWIATTTAAYDYHPGVVWEEFYPPSALGGLDLDVLRMRQDFPGLVEDFEAMHGRPLAPADLPPPPEPERPRQTGWARVTDDSFFPDD